jgi:hypothetical protein
MDFLRWAAALLRRGSGKDPNGIPVGFNSKESFAKMDEDGNVAN